MREHAQMARKMRGVATYAAGSLLGGGLSAGAVCAGVQPNAARSESLRHKLLCVESVE